MEEQSSNKLIYVVLGVVVVLGIIAVPFFLNSRQPATTTDTTNTTLEVTSDLAPESTGALEDGEKVKRFTVDGSDFNFTPSELTVNEGDTVIITFRNSVGTHDLRVEGYNIGTKIIPADSEETIQFIASEPGSFEYYCSVGSHRQMGMVGTLTVNPAN